MSSLQGLQLSTKKPRRSDTRRRKPAGFRDRRRFLNMQLHHSIDQIHLRQQILHYHITQLTKGDKYLRKHFNLLQRYYEQALSLSTLETRSYLKYIDLYELRGFSTSTITGLESSDDDLEDISDDEEQDEDYFHNASFSGTSESPQQRSTTRIEEPPDS
ncbi:hypothetical protein RRF57_002309 [Xylaria bambusicola]|uniref:Uncharacterized protein n=1 Tax=Xylaria bambusicola TaxID=326684 RepID=A0AAN7UIT5_9PEZI